MKTRIIALFGVIGMGIFALSLDSVEIYDACNSLEAKQNAKNALKPDYQYDASKTSKFTFKNQKQFVELEIPLFSSEQYRFVFNTEGLPQDVDVEVYNHKYESKNRELLYSSRGKDIKGNQIVFEPKHAGRRVFVDYMIPPTADSLKRGCVVMALGYKANH